MKTEKLKYIQGLDVLRAFAVLSVIITHWGPAKFSSEIATFFLKLFPNGGFGVDLFFVLSGYLITKILLNARFSEEHPNNMQIIKAFYVRRSLRIFPVYFLIVFISYFFDSLVREKLWCFLTYTSNFLFFELRHWGSIGHTWSLAIEEQFYLIWPWLIVFTPKKYIFHVIIAFLGIGLISTFFLHQWYGHFFYILTSTCFTAFAVGALYAYLQKNDSFLPIFKRYCKILLPICLILYLFGQFGSEFSFIRLINAVISINLIVYVVREKYNSFTTVIFRNKFLTYVGKISYGIYIYHYMTPSYYFMFIDYLHQSFHFTDRTLRLLKYPPSGYLIELCIVLAVSYLSFHYLEKQFIKLKASFNYTKKFNQKALIDG